MTGAGVSLVIPAYNEGDALVAHLCELLSVHHPEQISVIDASAEADYVRVSGLLKAACPMSTLDYLVAEKTGRAQQMNQGANNSREEILLFLHADTRLPGGALEQIRDGLKQGQVWGRFDLRFDNPGWSFRLIAFMMNWRSRLSGIATGDQAMFMTRKAFMQVRGFDEIPLMEDIAMSRKLKKLGRPLCLSSRVTTAARRWEQKGIIRTILLMWGLRLAYWLGVSPQRLAEWYRT